MSRERFQASHSFCVGESEHKWSNGCVFLDSCVLWRKASHSCYSITLMVLAALLRCSYECASAAPLDWRANSQGSFPLIKSVFWSPYAHLPFNKLREWIVQSSIFHLKTLLIEWRKFRALKLFANPGENLTNRSDEKGATVWDVRVGSFLKGHLHFEIDLTVRRNKANMNTWII